MTWQVARSERSDVEQWLEARHIASRDVDVDDMLTYIQQWEDAYPETAEAARTSAVHQAEVETIWEKAFEASRVTVRVQLPST